MPRPTKYAIKAPVQDHAARTYRFADVKTMYAGKRVKIGDTVFVFDSENEGGQGLFARTIVTAVEPTPPRPNVERQTPRISVTLKRTGSASRHYGRADVKHFKDWNDGQPETEINFKFYRQATNKLVGLSDSTAEFLDTLF